MSYPIRSFLFGAAGAEAEACAGLEEDEGSDSGHSSATVQLAISKLLSRHSKWIRSLLVQRSPDKFRITQSPVWDFNKKSCGIFQHLKQDLAEAMQTHTRPKPSRRLGSWIWVRLEMGFGLFGFRV